MALRTMTSRRDTAGGSPSPPGLRRRHDGGRSLTGEQAERLITALREMDARIGYTVHYGPGDVPLCGEEPVGAHWTDEPKAVAGCDDCLDLVAEDLADDNEYQGRCLNCQQVISAKGWRPVTVGRSKALPTLRKARMVTETQCFTTRGLSFWIGRLRRLWHQLGGVLDSWCGLRRWA